MTTVAVVVSVFVAVISPAVPGATAAAVASQCDKIPCGRINASLTRAKNEPAAFNRYRIGADRFWGFFRRNYFSFKCRHALPRFQICDEDYRDSMENNPRITSNNRHPLFFIAVYNKNLGSTHQTFVWN